MLLVLSIIFSITSNNLNYLDSLYKNGEYTKVVEQAEELIIRETNKQAKIEIYKITAFANVALDLNERAKEYFTSLLAIAPNYYLDPVKTSPKIIEIFQEAKSALAKTPVVKQQSIKPNPFIYFYPGVYQIRNENKFKGYTLLSLQTTSILGFIAFSILTPIYHQKYLDKKMPDDIDRAYNQYRTCYIARQIFGTGILVSFGLHLLDLKF